jgi:hypothetical protein
MRIALIVAGAVLDTHSPAHGGDGTGQAFDPVDLSKIFTGFLIIGDQIRKEIHKR